MFQLRNVSRPEVAALQSSSALEDGPQKGTADVIYSVNLGHPQREDVGIEADGRDERGVELVVMQRQDGSTAPVLATQAADTGMDALQGDEDADTTEMLALPEPERSAERHVQI